MELRDYIAALRRYWPTWVGITLAGVVIALAVVQFSPRTYEATAQVFVSSSAEGAGNPQFVTQRVKSYPDVAVSAAVLGPAAERLDPRPTVRDLRRQVTAGNPVDTSQINIVATSGDPEDAAAIANAVADRFTGVVEELEQPASGRSPVALTVTNPATAPTGPVSPQALYVLVLGVVVGLFLGLATAIIRSRVDTRVHTAFDVRSAWGADDELPVLTTPAGRRRPGRLTGDPAHTLARRLEVLAERAPVRLSFLSPAAQEQPAARVLAAEVAAALDALGLPEVTVGSAASSAADAARVRIEIADPLAPLRVWRSVAASTDGIVLVVPAGRVAAAELAELRTVLDDAGLSPLAVVVTPRPSRRPWSRSAGAGTGSDGDARPAGTATRPATAEAARGPLAAAARR
jgi:capsular polysaccharide biosynthesis protein